MAEGISTTPFGDCNLSVRLELTSSTRRGFQTSTPFDRFARQYLSLSTSLWD